MPSGYNKFAIRNVAKIKDLKVGAIKRGNDLTVQPDWYSVGMSLLNTNKNFLFLQILIFASGCYPATVECYN